MAVPLLMYWLQNGKKTGDEGIDNSNTSLGSLV